MPTALGWVEAIKHEGRVIVEISVVKGVEAALKYLDGAVEIAQKQEPEILKKTPKIAKINGVSIKFPDGAAPDQHFYPYFWGKSEIPDIAAIQLQRALEIAEEHIRQTMFMPLPSSIVKKDETAKEIAARAAQQLDHLKKQRKFWW